MEFLLLADGTTKTASETVTVLQQLIQGGVPLICLGIAVVFGIAAVYLYKQNQVLQKERAEREAAVQADRALLEKDYREKVEVLMREMLDRGNDGQEVISSNTGAVRDLTGGLQNVSSRLELLERLIGSRGS